MLAPRIDPKYEVVRKLREGGMGAIYLVRHRLLDELRVVKVLRSHLDRDEDLRQRFLREAKTAIQLRHPNIAQLYDFSVDDEGNASIVLEYIDGLTLEEFGRQPEARDPALALAISRQALRALGFLHRKGFVHRDIAPDNLMLTADVDGEPLVKLIDLGIVKILRGGEGKGTATALYLGKPRYSSPEQLTSPEIDARSDLYSFGILLYELLTGCYPIRGHDLPSLIAAHLHGEPLAFELSDPDGRVPPPLRDLLMACLAKRPEHRPGSAEELAEQLERIARALPPAPTGDFERRIAGARAGARRRRESELAEAAGAVEAAIARDDFVAARARLAKAAEDLGSDPELLELGRRLEAREQEVRLAAAEVERLSRRLAEAEAAFERGDLPGALSQITEVLARRPDDPRARALATRIETRRREAELEAARAGAARAAGAETGATLAARRSPYQPALHEAPTAELPVPPRTRPPAPLPAPAAVAAAAAPAIVAEPVAEAAPAPRGHALRWSLLALVSAAAVAGGWLLWRGMNGAAGATNLGAPPTVLLSAAYRDGLRALAAGDPASAAPKLRAALAEDSRERPGYLPFFHLGQALVALDQCPEALKALHASEQQGVLAATPEAAQVPALRASCAESRQLEQALRPAEETLALLDKQLAEIAGTRTSTEVAAMWSGRPELLAGLDEVRALVDRGRDLAARARSEQQLDLAFQAADTAADARAKLQRILRAAGG